MKRHRRLWALVLVASLGLLCGVSAAQPLTIPSNIRVADSIGPAERALIKAFVTRHVADLDAEKPETQQAARNILTLPVTGGVAGQTISPAFLSAYAEELNAAVVAANGPLRKGARLRTRLLAGVVVATVARESKTASVALLPAAHALLTDPSDAVALWGMKAAKAILPDLVRVQPAQKLSALVLQTAQNRKSGLLAAEAYEALNTGDGTMVATQLQLFSGRVALYRNGIPDGPQAEERPLVYLTVVSTWGILSPAQKTQTVQLLSDLLLLSARHYENADARARDELLSVIVQGSKVVWVLGQPTHMADANLVNAANQGSRLNATSTPAQVKDAIDGIHAALKQAFPGLQPLNAAAPASGDANR